MDESEALEHQPERLDVAVAGPPADVERLAGVHEGRLGRARAVLAERHQREHQAVLGPDGRALGTLVGSQQPAGRVEPSGDHREPQRDGGVPAEAERHPSRRPAVGTCEIGRVRLFADGRRPVELPRPGRAVAEQLEVDDIERCGRGRLRQGFEPRPTTRDARRPPARSSSAPLPPPVVAGGPPPKPRSTACRASAIRRLSVPSATSNLS